MYSLNHSGPSWLKNLYFAYLLVLRAISKMEPYWSSHHFYTGNKTEDAVVREEVMLMIQATKYVSWKSVNTLILCTSYHTSLSDYKGLHISVILKWLIHGECGVIIPIIKSI